MRLALLAVLAATTAAAQPPAADRIPLAEYAARRDSLAARIDSGFVVAFGNRTLVHDFSPFFQLPAFHYLTGYDEPDAAFVMVVRGKRGASTLFVTPLSPRSAIFYGQRASPDETRRRYGIPGRPSSALAAVVDSLAKTGLPLYTLADFENADFARADTLTRGQAFVKSLLVRHPKLRVVDAHDLVDRLRARKSPAEMALIRRAVEISAEGHKAAMMAPSPRHEYELRAAVEHAFTRLGAERPAYGSIVGAGINGTTLHYMKDMDPVRPGDLVVIDAGAEYRGYAADITRTLPASGTFTPEQRQLYELVLEAQKAAERNSKAGMSARAAQDSSVAVRAKGLAALGLIEGVDATYDPPGQVDCERQPRQCRQSGLWTIHGISHGIGLAVHDPMHPYFDDTFRVGDAFTIEPGIYVSTRALETLPDTPKNRAFIAKVRATVLKYESSGVRIEDDYIITERGLERISSGVPREIEEIEALMRRRAPVP